MATGYVDPSGDDTQVWNAPTATPVYTEIDDGIRQPTAPNTADYDRDAGATEKIDIFDMDTITNVDEVTQVKLWAYGKIGGLDPAECHGDVYLNGSWTSLTDFVFTTSYAWKSITYNGSWTQADLDALQVKLRKINTGFAEVAAVYCEVTYTAAAGHGSRIVASAIHR